MIGFEWDPKKAASNLTDHKVSFEQAAIACRDLFAVEWIDDREDYDEGWLGLLGLYGLKVVLDVGRRAAEEADACQLFLRQTGSQMDAGRAKPAAVLVDKYLVAAARKHAGGATVEEPSLWRICRLALQIGPRR